MIILVDDPLRFDQKKTIERHPHPVCSYCCLYAFPYHLLAFKVRFLMGASRHSFPEEFFPRLFFLTCLFIFDTFYLYMYRIKMWILVILVTKSMIDHPWYSRISWYIPSLLELVFLLGCHFRGKFRTLLIKARGKPPHYRIPGNLLEPLELQLNLVSGQTLFKGGFFYFYTLMF